MKFRLFAIFCISSLFYLGSCTPEPKDPPILIEDVLPGYWELINATRNGKTVPSLQGAYFEFDSLGTISTNFTGDQVVTNYSIADSSIVYSDAGKDNKLDFHIKSPDTLIFQTVMRKIFKFDLTLLRTEKK